MHDSARYCNNIVYNSLNCSPILETVSEVTGDKYHIRELNHCSCLQSSALATPPQRSLVQHPCPVTQVTEQLSTVSYLNRAPQVQLNSR